MVSISKEGMKEFSRRVCTWCPSSSTCHAGRPNMTDYFDPCATHVDLPPPPPLPLKKLYLRTIPTTLFSVPGVVYEWSLVTSWSTVQQSYFMLYEVYTTVQACGFCWEFWSPHWRSGKASASRAVHLGSIPATTVGLFFRSSHTSDLKMETLVAALPGAWLALAGYFVQCQYTLTGWDGKFYLQVPSQVW